MSWVVLIVMLLPALVRTARINTSLLCLLDAAMGSDELPDLNVCFHKSIQERPLVAAAFVAERTLQQGGDPGNGGDFCQAVSADDFFEQRLAYTRMISSAVQMGYLPELVGCSHLPSSQYILGQARIYEANEQQVVFAMAIMAAYELDTIWSRPLWRGINAQQVGELHANNQNWTDAFQAYQRALDSFQSEPNLDPTYLARSYQLMGQSMVNLGNDAEALSLYQQSIYLFPVVPQSLIDAFVDTFWQFDQPSVESVYELTQEKRPDSRFLFQLFSALIENEKAESVTVQTLLLEAKTMLPAAEFQVVLGMLARQERDFPRAQAFFESALETGSITHADTLADIYTRLAIIYVLDQQLDQGINAQRQVLVIKPENARAWYQLANYLEADNRLDEAREAMEQALRLQPDNVEFLSFAVRLGMQSE
ncbi:MAG: tetratricopeptide repeat protein [Anaerolineae bacterium]|nr:tetratricopeptide repeat protein [Anaerolineae bacterium]